MKVLIYVNKAKDENGVWLNKLKSVLEKRKTDYAVIDDSCLSKKTLADAIIVLGGDGTILGLAKFSADNQIPLIGINAGKLGFLTEFERYETETAVDLLLDGKLKTDNRMMISVDVGDKSYAALNDVVIQRIFDVSHVGTVIGVNVSIDAEVVDNICGDGVILCTPTGSTAYSLSAGGAILAPGINAFSVTPIAAHSLSHRPIICSAEQRCEVTLCEGDEAGVFADGKLITRIKKGEKVCIKKSNKNVIFLRDKEYSFFNRLFNKMKNAKENVR